MNITSAGRTDTGIKRANNEDAYMRDNAMRLYAVADGVGGHQGGEVASRIIMDTIQEVVPGLLSGKDSTPPVNLLKDAEPRLSALKYAVTLSNNKIFQASKADPSLAGMGSTATLLHLWRDKAYIAHVGDSRVYLLRNRTLRQITGDHSLVAEQVRAGKIAPKEARNSAYRHIITRAVGIEKEVVVEGHAMPVAPGDVILLCTDGLTDMVDNDDIAGLLNELKPDQAADALVRLANERGGADNITVVIVRID